MNAHLSLTANDLEKFAQLVIPPELVAEACIQRVIDTQARTEFGMKFNSIADLSGLIFPYFIPPVIYRVGARLRRDYPEVIDGQIKNKYLSAYGDRKHLYFPPGARAKLNDPKVIIVLVESEKAALALTAWAERRGIPLLALALGGCWGWRGRVRIETAPNGERVEISGPLPDLHYCDDHRVYVLLDSNVATNPKVQAARSALVRELSKPERKCRVMVCELPLVAGINGPDDYVGMAGDDAMAEVFRRAYSPVDRKIGQGRTRNTAGREARYA